MKTYNWSNAKRVITRLNKKNYRGHNDWRMPTIQELVSIINYEKVNPACDLPDTVATYYWSSTTNASNTGIAWYVLFSYGNVFYDYKSSNNYVRAVRGKRKLEWSETL